MAYQKHSCASTSGYTISNVHYTLDSTSPARVNSVSFTTAPVIAAPGTAKVEITNSSVTSWHNCTVGATVTCDLTVDTGGGQAIRSSGDWASA